MAAAEPVSIAVLAKAPVAGFAKTRLIPALGAGRAANLQARLTDRTVETACAAATGPVTVWATPDETHATFQMLHTHRKVALARQPDGDLGARILAALKASGGRDPGHRHRLPRHDAGASAQGGGRAARRRRRGGLSRRGRRLCA